MILRNLAIAAAMLSMGFAALAPAQAAIPSENASPSAVLASAVLNELQQAPVGDKEAVLAGITRATRGAELRIIVDALRLLRRGQELDAMTGGNANDMSQARATLARPEVQEALAEAYQIAELALASYGATGSVPAGGAPGQAFGSGGVGAPGGGGGSGYTN